VVIQSRHQSPLKSFIQSPLKGFGQDEAVLAPGLAIREVSGGDLNWFGFGNITGSFEVFFSVDLYRADTNAIFQTATGVSEFHSDTTFTRQRGDDVIDTPDGYTEITMLSVTIPNFRLWRMVAWNDTSKTSVVLDESPYGYFGDHPDPISEAEYLQGVWWSDTTTDTFDPPAGYDLTDCVDDTEYNTNPDTYQKVSFPLTEDVAPDLAVDSTISTLTIWNIAGDPDEDGRGTGYLLFKNVTVQDSESGSLCVQRNTGNYGLSGTSHWDGGDMIQFKRITTASGPDYLIDTWIRTDTDLDDLAEWVNGGNTWIQFDV
jgi:hypothetical protein